MNEYYKNKLKQGLYYQDMIVEKLYEIGLPIISYSSKEFQYTIGENKAGIEIKNDTRFLETKNFYIEISEKSNSQNINFIKSGIYRDDNTWLYVIGNDVEFHVFSKKQLVLLHKSKKYKTVETPTSKGFLLPYVDAVSSYSLKIVKLNDTNKKNN